LFRWRPSRGVTQFLMRYLLYIRAAFEDMKKLLQL
jgi:hypothetical protein